MTVKSSRVLSQNKGLKFLKSFLPRECPNKDLMCVQKTGLIDVYEVIAQPIEPAMEPQARVNL